MPSLPNDGATSESLPNGFKINAEQRLYVLQHCGGYTCLGFEVAHRRAANFAAFAGRPDLAPKAEPGGRESGTGKRDETELTPALRGLEGKRVEVTYPDGERTRFYVGRSTGWTPIHLEIKTRASSGGAPVYFPAGSTVRVIGTR